MYDPTRLHPLIIKACLALGCTPEKLVQDAYLWAEYTPTRKVTIYMVKQVFYYGRINPIIEDYCIDVLSHRAEPL